MPNGKGQSTPQSPSREHRRWKRRKGPLSYRGWLPYFVVPARAGNNRGKTEEDRRGTGCRDGFGGWREKKTRPSTFLMQEIAIRQYTIIENPGWGAPKIDGELLKLGFDISERSVSRYLRRVYRRGDPETSWLTFLRNHREMIVALDFFTVPTVTFHQLYCLFVIEHGRRRILYCNVTRHPTADWVLQQLREAFPEAGPYRYVILDRDTKFDTDVINFLKSTGLKPKRTSLQAPWQNGIAERWIGSCRRELLDHIIALNEWHLLRLVREYVTYHHDDRIHDSLDKDCPCHRVIEHRPGCKATVTAGDRVGGLHHRYLWHIAA